MNSARKIPPAIIVIFLVYAIFLSWRIADPFWGINDDNPAVFGAAAKNWLALGPIELKFTQLLAGGD